MLDGEKRILRALWEEPGANAFFLDTQQYLKSHFQPSKHELQDIAQYFDDEFPSLVVPAREELNLLLEKCPLLRSADPRKIIDKIKFVAELWMEKNEEVPNLRELMRSAVRADMKKSERFKKIARQPVLMIGDMSHIAKVVKSPPASRSASRAPSRAPSRASVRPPVEVEDGAIAGIDGEEEEAVE
jgi:hypothetical protein